MHAIESAHRYVEAWNARDTARLAATFRAGGTYQDPNTGGAIGPDALAGYAAGLFAAFPDLWFEELEYREGAGGQIVFLWIMRGTNRGAIRGLPPTGKTIALPGVDLIEVCDDGVQRVQGFFDRQTLMEQLGLQVVAQPHSIGPIHFGVCTQVRSGNQAVPGTVALTMIEARTDEEVQRIRDASRRIMLELVRMPGFLSFQGAVVGRRLTTVTLWESREAARQVMREANHKQASVDMFGGSVGRAFHGSTWELERLGELWIRCDGCGGLRDGRKEAACRCGAGAVERPAFW